MRRGATGLLTVLFVLTALGFVLVILGLTDKQRQIDALRQDVEALSHGGAGEADADAPPPSSEDLAVATLRNVVSAQAMLKMTGKADQDEDGNGEYGGLLEMSGRERGRLLRLVQIPLFPEFEFASGSGEATLGGYCFRVYLPDARGAPVAEPAAGFSPPLVDAKLCERVWCCYAWPLTADAEGARAFFTNQEGNVLYAESTEYVGVGGGPPGDAAFASAGTITGKVAVDSQGADGNSWHLVRD
jgi:hypothetical protein